MRRQAENRTDSSLHAEMLIQTTDGPVEHDGKHFSPGGSGDSFVSSDPKEVAAFFKRQCLTGGFSVQYAVNRETREVVHILKKGKLAQRDVKPLIAEGFDEWTFSWCWAPDHFRFPDGEIVKVARKIDASPVATTREAYRWGKALGRI